MLISKYLLVDLNSPILCLDFMDPNHLCLYLRPHYNLNLESIAVNGQTLSIDSSVFATSNTQGTIIDSGTTLAYLAEQAYDPFINAVS